MRPVGHTLNRRRARRRLLAAGSLLGGLLACSDDVPVYCVLESVEVRLVPADTAMTVGQSFTPSVSVTNCRGRSIAHPRVLLSTTGAAIAVDSATGTVTAIQPGMSSVRVTVEHWDDIAELPVMVTPAP